MSERTNAETREWAESALAAHGYGKRHGRWTYRKEQAMAAAIPGALEALVAKCDEVDRLTRILAVERGDESAAPEGWKTARFGTWIHPETDSSVIDDGPCERFIDDDPQERTFVWLLEAMEALNEDLKAADKAREASDGDRLD